MPRPTLLAHESSESDVAREYRGNVPELVPLLAEIAFFVIPAKLDVGDLYDKIEALGGTYVSDIADARIVITALKGRPRLERTIGRAVDRLPILRPEFITDTYERCMTAARTGDFPNLPSRDRYIIHVHQRTPSAEQSLGEKRSRSPSIEALDGPPAKRLRNSEATHKRIVSGSSRFSGTSEVENEFAEVDVLSVGPDVAPYPSDVNLRDIPRMACLRPSPLVCPNQDIIDAIKPIYLEREYDEMTQINSNVLSYRRSMAILKSVPRRIRSGAEAMKLVDVGEKVANRIDEYLTTGQIEEAEVIRTSERYKALELFASVYSIGHSTASELWGAGCRTLEHVRAYFARSEPENEREERKMRHRQGEGNMTRSEIVDAWLDLKADLDSKISRSEVLEIADCVQENLDALLPGCAQTICGGFRRGKEDTGDVDVIFRPPVMGQDVGLLQSLYRRLVRLGIITHVLHVTQRDPRQPLHSTGANFDNLDKTFVIFRLPGKGRLHRRVDLICAPHERYAAAVLSWSGSMMFERDLRRWAENRGYKFRAGLIRIETTEEINFETEREIFAFLGLRRPSEFPQQQFDVCRSRHVQVALQDPQLSAATARPEQGEVTDLVQLNGRAHSAQAVIATSLVKRYHASLPSTRQGFDSLTMYLLNPEAVWTRISLLLECLRAQEALPKERGRDRRPQRL